MPAHLQKELGKLKQKLLSLGTMVEDRFRRAVDAISTMDVVVARQIAASDFEVDEMEVEIEEECLKILALHQPVAVDLRFLVAVIKINNDLERIGDLAVNISNRIMASASTEGPDLGLDYTVMAQRTGEMLQKSLDAFVSMDTDMANHVRLMDDEVDKMLSDVYDRIKKTIRVDSEHVGSLINMFLISRHLERIADHATNIAEEVIYMIDGEIVRHEDLG